jgi:hypothetical protein
MAGRSASGSGTPICCGLRGTSRGALVEQARVEEGLRLVDEALVVATAGELSPVVTGLVYCNTIAFCRDVYELRHAWEWTEALTLPTGTRQTAPFCVMNQWFSSCVTPWHSFVQSY